MRNRLIAYAMHFASFLVEKGIKAKRIILFGSVASGEFDKESDIDIFVDTDKREENDINSSLRSFEKTFGEKWRLKGIGSRISITVGDLNSKGWEDLRRTIQSYGIVLYGQYKEPPKNIQPYVLFKLSFKKISRSKKVSLWRKLYGYTQKVGKKSYKSSGLLENLGGVKTDKGVVLVPASRSSELKGFLGRNRISYSLVEVWTDQFSHDKEMPYVGKKVIGKL